MAVVLKAFTEVKRRQRLTYYGDFAVANIEFFPCI